MFFDFSEASTRLDEASYDVCICGTGPAGITTARKMASAGKKVLLLEGGGLEYSDQSQDIYDGHSTGRQYWHVQNGRLRYFGGTSNHWTGRCGIFDPIDFEEREYFGLPGWPIPREQVLNRLQEAQNILDIQDESLVPSKIPQLDTPLFAGSGFALSTPTRFSEKFYDELKHSSHIDLFYNANLADIKLSDDLARVVSVSVKGFNDRKVNLKAKRIVLALGAIETARLLLNSNSQVSEGVGNRTGMVGRCFMEHLNVSIGRFLVTDPSFWKQKVQLAATETLMRSYNVGNGILDFEAGANPKSYGRLRIVKQFLRETGCSWPAVELTRKLADFDCAGDGLITSLIEQVPNPNSRVTLSDDVDRSGLRRVRLDWNLNDRDMKTIRVLAVLAAKEMARFDRCRVQLAQSIIEPTGNIEVGGHAHQMGTARMSADPRYGVVDENCQVHGIENLYVIGSSVFPTGGGTNPTLTIVLLSLRLGEFLSR